jgi:hypothetical protein
MLKEAVVSVTTLGAAFGAFSGGFFSDYYGRCARTPALPRSVACVRMRALPLARRRTCRAFNTHAANTPSSPARHAPATQAVRHYPV